MLGFLKSLLGLDRQDDVSSVPVPEGHDYRPRFDLPESDKQAKPSIERKMADDELQRHRVMLFDFRPPVIPVDEDKVLAEFMMSIYMGEMEFMPDEEEEAFC